MDIYGMYDRLLEHSGKALSWLERNSPTEAIRELRLVVEPDGKYVPRVIGEVPAEPKAEDPGLVAHQIVVRYDDGKHLFSRVGPDEWTLNLSTPVGDGPTVTGYDDANVLRVLGAFLGFENAKAPDFNPATRLRLATIELTAAMTELASALAGGVILPLDEAVAMSALVAGDPLPSEVVAAQEKIRAAADADA